MPLREYVVGLVPRKTAPNSSFSGGKINLESVICCVKAQNESLVHKIGLIVYYADPRFRTELQILVRSDFGPIFSGAQLGAVFLLEIGFGDLCSGHLNIYIYTVCLQVGSSCFSVWARGFKPPLTLLL